jgi:putative acetyltransferase
MKTLETERLILRAWSPADQNDLFEYARNPNVGPNAGWKPHENPEESAAIISLFAEQDDVWAIEYRENHKVIGSVGLHEDRLRKGVNARMLGYVLSEDYWGRGLMTEAASRVIRFAFEEMSIDILSVFHYPHNMRSRRVIEKCGFVYEGTLRSASRIYDGTVLDGVCYSLLREEYFALPNGKEFIRIDFQKNDRETGE